MKPRTDPAKSRSNLRLGLIFASVALAFFFGIMIKQVYFS